MNPYEKKSAIYLKALHLQASSVRSYEKSPKITENNKNNTQHTLNDFVSTWQIVASYDSVLLYSKGQGITNTPERRIYKYYWKCKIEYIISQAQYGIFGKGGKKYAFTKMYWILIWSIWKRCRETCI